jgi:PAS domain S-box-containing protein
MLKDFKSNMSLLPQYFQKLVESCPDIIIAVDKQGTITFYNDGARQNLGLLPERSWERTSLRFIQALTRTAVMAAMRADEGEGKGRV